jgi:hypothetical protein
MQDTMAGNRVPTLNKNVMPITAYFIWREHFSIGIELEVAYDIEKRRNIHFECFQEKDDGSIHTEFPGARAQEFVLRREYRQYFKHKKKIDEEIETLLLICYPNNSSCGTHVHLSHPDITMAEYPNFLEYFTNYWAVMSQDKMRKKYPQVRDDTTYARDNKGYAHDKSTRYKQMNILPSFPNYKNGRMYDGTVHVEFRGYDGLPNPSIDDYAKVFREAKKDITGVGAVIEMQMLTYYIEDLCDEFVKAFYHFTVQTPLNLEIPGSVANVTMRVVRIMQGSSSQRLTPDDAFYKVLQTLGGPKKQEYLQATHETCPSIAPHSTLFTHILLHYVKLLPVDYVLDLFMAADIKTWNLSKRFDNETQTYVTPFTILWDFNPGGATYLLQTMPRDLFPMLDLRDLLAMATRSSYDNFPSLVGSLKTFPFDTSYSTAKSILSLVYYDTNNIETIFSLGDISFMGEQWIRSFLGSILFDLNST